MIDIDLRKKLTRQQKSAITRKHNKHKTIVTHLQAFAQRIVNKSTAKEIDTAALKVKTKSGKIKLFIPTPEGQTAHIKKGRVVIESKNYREEIYPGGWNFFKNAEKLFKKKLVKNEYITVRIGDNNSFNRTFKDINSLLFYMREWQPKDPLETKENLIGHISIVKVKDDLQTVYNYKGEKIGKKKKGDSKNSRY